MQPDSCPNADPSELLLPLALQGAAEVQDGLMVAAHDLGRLQRLLSDAAATLMGHFYGASAQVHALRLQHADAQASSGQNLPPMPQEQAIGAALQHLAGAVTALQFEDMAVQLIAHTTRRLRHCADRLAYEAMGGDEGDDDIANGPAYIEDAPQRPNPVTQDEVDAGSVELF